MKEAVPLKIGTIKNKNKTELHEIIEVKYVQKFCVLYKFLRRCFLKTVIVPCAEIILQQNVLSIWLMQKHGVVIKFLKSQVVRGQKHI